MVARAAHDVMRYRRMLATVPSVFVPAHAQSQLGRCLLLGYMPLPNFVQNLEPVPLLFCHPQPLSPLHHALLHMRYFTLDNGRKRAETCGPIQEMFKVEITASIVGR